MFKAMAKLNLGASVVKHRRAGSGAGGSRHGSVGDLSRAFEETTSVSSSPDLADVPRSLEAWAEQDSEDFDAGAFAAEHYGDAGERRVARLHAVLSALQEKAGDRMKQNVLDHHSAFVEVAREILASNGHGAGAPGPRGGTLGRGGRAPRGCGAGCRGGETRDDENERRRRQRGVARRLRSRPSRTTRPTRTRRRPRIRRVGGAEDPGGAGDARRAEGAARRTGRGEARSVLRGDFKGERGVVARKGGVPDDEASSPKTQTPPFPKTPFQKATPPPPDALLTAAAGARRAATAMLAEMAREEEPFDTLETLGVPVSAREPTRRGVAGEAKNETKETQ